MAKQTPASPSGRSKVRIFYIDADVAPGDLRELTNTFATAIRPTHTVTQTGQVQQLPPATTDGDGNGAHDAPVDLDDTAEVIEQPVDEAAPAKPTARRYKTPKIVDMDMNGDGTAFEDFARAKGPKSHRDKYLVAAAWCQEHAKQDGITPGHVLTCYKAADWTFDVTDPAVNLRSLKGERLLDSAARGKYRVNHLGLAEVKKMKAAT